MKDKEINVTKCQYHNKNGKCRIPHFENGIKYVSCNCDEWYCYFKQLQRKEQECEKLQEQVSKIKEYVRHNMFDVNCENWFEIFIYTFEDWKKSILENENKYKQECEELKKEIINKNEKIKELRFSVSDLTNRLCYLNAEKSFRIVDLEQTLDGIEKELKEDIYCENQECGCDDFEECLKCTKEHILDIINKAKGRNNE